MTEHGGRPPGGAEERADLSGLNRLSDRPPPPRGETTVRIVRAISILLLAIAAAGLPWYFVTRSRDEPKPQPRSDSTASRSPSPSPSGSAKPGTFEVFGVENCANVRAEPSTGAKRLTCLTAGIRLESDGQTQQAEGRLWRHVTYEKDNLTGWMADQYLKPV